jgi:LPS sulfotransferase NodH
MTTLKTTLEALLLAKGQELADTLADDSRTAVATVSYAMGMQTALELSQLSPEVARQLNQTALEFLSVYHLD